MTEVSQFSELANVIGEAELNFLIETFLGEAPVMLRELREAMTQKDELKIDRTLHNLKGAAATLGFEHLAELAQSYRKGGIDNQATARLAEEIDAIGESLKRNAA